MSSEEKNSEQKPERREFALIEHPSGNHRPFMRGIMIHSLTERGIPYDDAVRTANAVREKIRGKAMVARTGLAKYVEEILGHFPSGDLVDKRRPPTSITISGKGRIPFSKGFLSQSLLASAIDPSDAFEVAKEIELDLLRSGVTEIPRRDLRQKMYDALSSRAGEDAARRYLVWRQFQDPEKPVIILLGGATGVGKTSLAVEVAHRLGIHRVLSTDSIRQVMRMMLSPELMPAIHASSYDAYRSLASMTDTSVDPVIEGFKQQTSVVAVGVQAMMDRAINENSSMVLDGVSIVPSMIDLDAYRDSAHVIFIMVAALDEESIKSRFETRAKDQILRKPHLYIENIDSILKIQDYLLQLADQQDVPIVHNKSFDRSVLSLLRSITDILGKDLPADPDALF